MKWIALHGNLGSTADYHFLPEAQAIDLWQYSHLSLVEAAQQIDAETRCDQPRALIGYSMGGRLALHMLTTNPKGWDIAIIISAHPGLVDEDQRLLRIKQDQQWADIARNEAWQQFLALWNNQPVLKDQKPSANQNALKLNKQAIALAFENWSLGKQADLTQGIATYTNPLTWVVGEQDQKFSTLAKQAANNFANHKVKVIANCGHRVLVEEPNIIRRICGFNK